MINPNQAMVQKLEKTCAAKHNYGN